MKTWRCSTAASARSGWMPAWPARLLPTRARVRSQTMSALPSRPMRKPTRARRGCTPGAWRSPPVPRPRMPPRCSPVGPPPRNTASSWPRPMASPTPPGTRQSTYSDEYMKAAPFAKVTLESLKVADPTKPTEKPVPYIGIQLVTIPEFQAIGTQVGKFFRGADRSADRRCCIDRRAEHHRAGNEAGWLPQVTLPHHRKCRRWLLEAGLPAMQTTRSIRNTEAMPSQASQLPQ